MKNNLIKISCLFLMIFIITGCGCNNKEKAKVEKKENPNTPIINYENVNNLKIGMASFYVDGEKTHVEVNVKNETNKNITANTIKIIIKDSSGKTIKTLSKKLGLVKAGQQITISDNVNEKLVSAAIFSYQIN